MRKENNQLFFDKQYATIHEVKDDLIDQKNELRVYNDMGESVHIQIRTHKPADEWQKGKPRKMIATLSVSIPELESILEFAKKHKQ